MVGTYWVRFDDFKGGPTRSQVIENAKTLVDCARDAGVERYVYTSHTQSDINCHIPYIAGKANVEAYVKKEF
jgi:nicotinamidase-related amidase